MASLRTVQKIVNNSAKLLDTEVPDWPQRITHKINMLCYPCIVTELNKSGINTDELGLSEFDVSRGFYIGAYDNLKPDNNTVLTRLWRYQLRKRGNKVA